MGRGRGQGKDMRGEEDRTQHNETYKHCLKSEKGGGNVDITEGPKLFKVHCTHVWNCQNEPLILLIINKLLKSVYPFHFTYSLAILGFELRTSCLLSRT
jgi:hypothetical protein